MNSPPDDSHEHGRATLLVFDVHIRTARSNRETLHFEVPKPNDLPLVRSASGRRSVRPTSLGAGGWR
jgi:hypothetical protein